MAKKYQTSFQYQIEESKSGFFKMFLILVILVIAGSVGYCHMVPKHERIGWFNTSVDVANKYYTETVLYISDYIPAIGDWTGVKPIPMAMSSNHMQHAPIKQENQKVKVYRSNKIQTEQ